MADYSYDVELYKKFDHIDIDAVDPDDKENTLYFVHFYLNDGDMKEYGPYYYEDAKAVMNNIVDDNVIYKFPFLKEPLKPENVDIDGASHFYAAAIKATKDSYILAAKKLKAHGMHIPISKEEYIQHNTDKQIRDAIQRESKTLELLDPKEDKELYSRAINRLKKSEHDLGGLYKLITFVEDGAGGILEILNGGFSSQEILKEWRYEALYGGGKKKKANKVSKATT